MLSKLRETCVLVAAFLSVCLLVGTSYAQSELRSLPDPYQPPMEHWGQLPEKRAWGAVSAMAFDSKGNLWVFERCGANSCADSTLAPILEFDPSGRLLTSFGAGMFVFPHGLLIDKDDNVWVTDADGKDGKGHQAIKFSPHGDILMKLGKAGVAVDGPDTFNKPSGVAIAKNGDIFVADGHGGNSNARIVKFSKDGKFIKAWGQKGSGPGEFNELHAIAIDTKGRVLVGDRGNNRIQIFDQEGKFLEEWKQFGIPSALYIDKHDILYVAENRMEPEGRRGISVGSAKDGKPTACIPDPNQDPKVRGIGSEAIAADAKGNIFSGQVDGKQVLKFARQ
jgi:hypothetical protein